MSAPSGGRSTQLHATTFRDGLLPVELRFDPPYVERSPAPANFSYWWQLLEVVFALPDPSDFSTLDSIDQPDSRTLNRFVSTCRDLAESTVLSNRGTTTIRFTTTGVTAEAVDPPSREALRGTGVTLRQFFSNDEKASFLIVRNLLGKLIAKDGGIHHAKRREIQKAWSRAHGQLRGGSLLALADHIGATRSGFCLPEGEADRDHVRPEQVLSMFYYGDHIHWSGESKALEAYKSDAVIGAMADVWLLETINQLGHFYLGYGKIVESALGSKLLSQ